MKKKALKKDFLMEVKNSLNRYISILLIVALGVAFFSGVRASESDMQITADRYFDDTDFMDIRVVSTMGLTDNDLLAISEINGVSKVETVKTLDVLSTTSEAEYIFKLFSKTETINKIKIIEGRLPEKNNECLVDSLYASESKGKIGDIITFRSGNDTNIEESLKETKYTIVGIGDSPNYLSYKRGNSSIGNGDVDFFAVIAPETFLSEIYSEIYVTVENTKSLNSYLEVYEDRVEVVRNRIENIAGIQTELRYREVLKDPLKELETAKNDLEEAKEKTIIKGEKELSELEMPKWYVLDRNSVQTYVEYGQDAKRIGNIGKVFPVIFFLVAALVSLTTMTRMVEEQRTQIGTLKALGYSKRSIAAKYMLYALSASMLGSLIGVLIGEQVLPKVIIIAYKIMYYTLPKPITPYNYYYGILSTVVAILCTTLAAFFASYKELAARPAELMRPVAPKSGKRVILEYLPFIWGKLNFTSKAAVRNLLRYKKRFFMTVFGIGSCTALLIVGFGIKDSISAISDIQYVDLWKQDVILSLNEDVSAEEKTSFLEELRLDERISGAILVNESTMDARMGKTLKSVNLVTPKDKKEISDYLVLRDRKSGETYELQDNGVIITEKLAVLLKVDIGDAIYLEDGDKNRVEVEITAVVENYMMHYIFISSHLYEELYGTIPNYNSVYLKCDISETLETSFAKDLLEKSIVTNVSFTSEFQKQISDMLNSLNLVVYVLIISAGLLAFIVMYNLNNININERKRELATLKVLGFMDLEVGTYVYRENIMLTIIGSVFGILLGIFLHYFVIVTAELDSMMFGRNIKMISFIYSVLLTFVFSIFVNFVMYFKLQKINMVESLKSVE